MDACACTSYVRVVPICFRPARGFTLPMIRRALHSTLLAVSYDDNEIGPRSITEVLIARLVAHSGLCAHMGTELWLVRLQLGMLLVMSLYYIFWRVDRLTRTEFL